MGKIWTVLMIASVAMSLLGGRGGDAAGALLDSGGHAVTLMLTLLGTMTLWSGLMEILDAAGDAARMGRLFRKILKPLFPQLQDEEAWNAMSLNLSANLLGLGNAATPAGIEAARRLAVLGEPGVQALAMLLVLDNASMQLIPTTVMTLRQAAGAGDPGDIWGMTLLVSGTAMVLAAMMMKLLQRGGKKHGRHDGRSHRRAGGADHPAGIHDGL